MRRRMVRVRRPHLLPVHGPGVAVTHGRCGSDATSEPAPGSENSCTRSVATDQGGTNDVSAPRCEIGRPGHHAEPDAMARAEVMACDPRPDAASAIDTWPPYRVGHRSGEPHRAAALDTLATSYGCRPAGPALASARPRPRANAVMPAVIACPIRTRRGPGQLSRVIEHLKPGRVGARQPGRQRRPGMTVLTVWRTVRHRPDCRRIAVARGSRQPAVCRRCTCRAGRDGRSAWRATRIRCSGFRSPDSDEQRLVGATARCGKIRAAPVASSHDGAASPPKPPSPRRTAHAGGEQQLPWPRSVSRVSLYTQGPRPCRYIPVTTCHAGLAGDRMGCAL